MPQSDKIDQVSAALMQAISNIEPVVKNSENPYFKSKYADRDSVLKAISGPCQGAGLVVSQFPSGGGMTTKLMHPASGQYLEEYVEFSYDKKGPQAQGACLTYLSRYSLCLIFRIELPDDDGESGHAREETKGRQPDKPTITVQGIIKGLEQANSEERIQEIMLKTFDFFNHQTPAVQVQIEDARELALARVTQPPEFDS